MRLIVTLFSFFFKPNLTDYMYGAEGNSRIFHAQELEYFYEYHQYNCYTKEVHLQCIYGKS